MKTRTVEVPLYVSNRSAADKYEARTMRVTLPWPETFEIDLDRTSEAERLPPPIRSDFDWRKDSVLRHASRVRG